MIRSRCIWSSTFHLSAHLLEIRPIPCDVDARSAPKCHQRLLERDILSPAGTPAASVLHCGLRGAAAGLRLETHAFSGVKRHSHAGRPERAARIQASRWRLAERLPYWHRTQLL